MFDGVRLKWKIWRSYAAGEKKGRRFMEKHPLSSMTIWGGIILEVGGIMVIIGNALANGDGMDFGQVAPKVAALSGFVFALFGMRKKLGSM